MTTKRVLVTGPSSFIGRPLVAALLRAGYAVRAATHSLITLPDSVDVAIVPDFGDSIDWNPILQGVDIVVHLAGLAHADSRFTAFSAFNQINCKATQVLARAAKGAGVDRFVFISSVRAQVGPCTARPVRERDEPHPTDHYGRSKLAAELAIRAAGVPYTILRPVVVYGRHPKGNVKLLVRLASSPWPLPFADFNNRRSLLGIDNLIAAILFVLNNPATVDETFLVADSAPITLREIFSMLRKAQGRRPRLVYVPRSLFRLLLHLPARTALWERIAEDLVVDTSKLESLGWRPAVGTYEGFVAMVRAENGETSQQSLDRRCIVQ